ncbi:arsenate reductase [Microbacterium phage Zeta1847]|uniref:Arsenate reductase n=1 Tax=Microbacterium phage Zeta1847 TaxID=2201444 RepID=A0A2Z4QA00_9CAUD|nr:arsenate reductase [Microbacterium phage Zeta1847]AWY06669.1 arsenate reductase [Microbacterium phage Zeta1847]
MRLTVYTRSLAACVQCDLTVRELTNLGIPHDVVPGIDTPELAETLEEFKARGLSSAPLVVAHDADGSELDAWAGFRPDKFKPYAA